MILKRTKQKNHKQKAYILQSIYEYGKTDLISLRVGRVVTTKMKDIIINGNRYVSISEYDEYRRLLDMEEGRLTDLTAGLRQFVKQLQEAEHFDKLMKKIIDFHIKVENK